MSLMCFIVHKSNHNIRMLKATKNVIQLSAQPRLTLLLDGYANLSYLFQGSEGDLRAWLMKHRPGVEANQTGRQPPRVSVSFADSL